MTFANIGNKGNIGNIGIAGIINFYLELQPSFTFRRHLKKKKIKTSCKLQKIIYAIDLDEADQERY